MTCLGIVSINWGSVSKNQRLQMYSFINRYILVNIFFIFRCVWVRNFFFCTKEGKLSVFVCRCVCVCVCVGRGCQGDYCDPKSVKLLEDV